MVDTFATESRISFARGYAAADISIVVVSIYHAINVTLPYHVRYHKGLRAGVQKGE